MFFHLNITSFAEKWRARSGCGETEPGWALFTRCVIKILEVNIKQAVENVKWILKLNSL